MQVSHSNWRMPARAISPPCNSLHRRVTLLDAQGMQGHICGPRPTDVMLTLQVFALWVPPPPGRRQSAQHADAVRLTSGFRCKFDAAVIRGGAPELGKDSRTTRYQCILDFARHVAVGDDEGARSSAVSGRIWLRTTHQLASGRNRKVPVSVACIDARGRWLSDKATRAMKVEHICSNPAEDGGSVSSPHSQTIGSAAAQPVEALRREHITGLSWGDGGCGRCGIAAGSRRTQAARTSEIASVSSLCACLSPLGVTLCLRASVRLPPPPLLTPTFVAQRLLQRPASFIARRTAASHSRPCAASCSETTRAFT